MKSNEADNRKPRPLLYRILAPIEVCLVVLLSFSFLFMAGPRILEHSADIILVYDIHGTSMYPTITEGTMTVVKKGGLEEVAVGDIIMFYEIDGPKHASSSSTTHLTKPDLPEDWMPGDPVPDASNTAETSDAQTVDAPACLLYDAHGNDVSKKELRIDTNRTTTHRIVQVGVSVDGQKIVYTEGDGNGYTDQYGTTADNFTGTVIWHAPGIGGFLLFWFRKGLFITLVAAVVIGAVIIVQKTHLNM